MGKLDEGPLAKLDIRIGGTLKCACGTAFDSYRGTVTECCRRSLHKAGSTQNSKPAALEVYGTYLQ